MSKVRYWYEAFLAVEANGVWGRAFEVPGTARLNVNGYASIQSVSCPKLGFCTAVGNYATKTGYHAMVVDEIAGRWLPAHPEPGDSQLATGHDSRLATVSCSSAGNCVAGGVYTRADGHTDTLIVAEVDGHWNPAMDLLGVSGLNEAYNASVNSIECSKPGNCTVAGSFQPDSVHTSAFVASEVSGHWEAALEIPGLSPLNFYEARVNSISCTAPGYCAVGGYYSDASGYYQAFLANQTNGRWSNAGGLTGVAVANGSSDSAVESVSCSHQFCVAGGYFTDSFGNRQPFVANGNGARGDWQSTELIPGFARFDGGSVSAMSCGSASLCVITGYYDIRRYDEQAFVELEIDGNLTAVEGVPGAVVLNKGENAKGVTISCSRTRCSVGVQFAETSSYEAWLVADAGWIPVPRR
jgi:hypothetical protein